MKTKETAKTIIPIWCSLYILSKRWRKKKNVEKKIIAQYSCNTVIKKKK